VDALYSVSAHKLPDVCVRFGLAAGTGEEAFRSKRAYVENRLSPLPFDRLLAVARAVQEDTPDHELGDVLARVDETGKRAVSELIRRAVLNVLDTCDLSGRIDLVEFISGMWPVERMSSPYNGGLCLFADAMVQHTRRNDDWTNGELLRHLGLLGCSQRRFFVLLEAVLHPRTRDEEEQRRIADMINKPLRRDGFALLPTGRLSGYPIYSVREVTPSHAGGAPADAEISAVLGAFDEAGVQAAWTKALERRDRDPEGAITMARTLLEKVCKHIIEEASGSHGENDDLPKLYHAAAENLNLAPSQHTEGAFKTILGNCQAVVQGIGTIRNKLGDSHGTGRKPARPQPRHAALAVNLAGTMAAFLVATWAARQPEKVA
jgi:hypothetical protein